MGERTGTRIEVMTVERRKRLPGIIETFEVVIEVREVDRKT